jgi:probable phosphoglycerate mutase
MVALRLFLVRHGETTANTEMRYLGSRDDMLTDHGLFQARRLARALAQLPITSVYTSPLRRAADTAAEIAETLKVEARLDNRLCEGSFGSWEGLTRAEVVQRGAQDAELLSRWEQDPACAPPGGEAFLQVQDRVVSLVRELQGTMAGVWIVLVSHVGPIKALLASALDIPLPSTRRLFLDPGTISVVDFGIIPVLRLFNSHEHLGWQAARWMKARN